MEVLGRGTTKDTVIVEMTGQEFERVQLVLQEPRVDHIARQWAHRNKVVLESATAERQYAGECQSHKGVVVSYGFPCPECAIEKGNQP